MVAALKGIAPDGHHVGVVFADVDISIDAIQMHHAPVGDLDQVKVLVPLDAREAKVVQIYRRPLLIAGGESWQTPYAISEDMKDYATNSIKMPAITLIGGDGNIHDEFGGGRDFILVQEGQASGRVDTVGYISNRVVHEAFATAKKAYAEERYEDAVKVFTSAFVAHPCTAKQYEALKAAGLN